MRARQRGMAAQVDLHRWREPAQVITRVAFRDEERRLGEAIFEGDFLHDGIVEPVFERHDSSRIAVKSTVGEGIDPIERQFHGRRGGGRWTESGKRRAEALVISYWLLVIGRKAEDGGQ